MVPFPSWPYRPGHWFWLRRACVSALWSLQGCYRVVQNNARAELYAVLQAVLSAPSGFIYSDSLGTVQGFQ